jgi:hypothetical protein
VPQCEFLRDLCGLSFAIFAVKGCWFGLRIDPARKISQLFQMSHYPFANIDMQDLAS